MSRKHPDTPVQSIPTHPVITVTAGRSLGVCPMATQLRRYEAELDWLDDLANWFVDSAT
ncbi:MAG: hypothetical protein ACI8TP_002539 [Acidimicrobiales bacterium]|jgi:hypothetical protein